MSESVKESVIKRQYPKPSNYSLISNTGNNNVF